MSDPQDTHKELTTNFRADEAAAGILTLLDLPQELILRIASLLEIRDLLALRRSHRFIYNVSKDKLLWRGILHDLRLPLPRALRSCHLDDLSYPELEKVVSQSYTVENRWLKRHDPSLTLLTRGEHSTIRLLDILDDRWIISIPTIGSPAIWDIRENPPKLCNPSESMSRVFQDETIDAAAAIDPHQGDIIIGLRKVRHPSQVVRLYLADPANDSFQLTAYGGVHNFDSGIVALEPSRNAVITELPEIGVQINDWTRSRTVEITSGLNDDRVSQPLLGLRLVGDYVLIFRSRWIELLPVPLFPDADEQSASESDENGPDLHRFYLKYQDDRFTGASLSEPQPNPESPDDSRVVYVLVQSTMAGFFYFRVTIHNPDYVPSGLRARMDIDLIGACELRKPQVRCREKLGACLALRSWLGPEGKRGIWIERPLSKLMNSVVAVSFDQDCSSAVPVESGDDLQELCEIAPRIESTGVIFTVESWNPHDDILRCAFSEATGKIALGTRDNRIILL